MKQTNPNRPKSPQRQPNSDQGTPYAMQQEAVCTPPQTLSTQGFAVSSADGPKFTPIQQIALATLAAVDAEEPSSHVLHEFVTPIRPRREIYPRVRTLLQNQLPGHLYTRTGLHSTRCPLCRAEANASASMAPLPSNQLTPSSPPPPSAPIPLPSLNMLVPDFTNKEHSEFTYADDKNGGAESSAHVGLETSNPFMGTYSESLTKEMSGRMQCTGNGMDGSAWDINKAEDIPRGESYENRFDEDQREEVLTQRQEYPWDEELSIYSRQVEVSPFSAQQEHNHHTGPDMSQARDTMYPESYLHCSDTASDSSATRARVTKVARAAMGLTGDPSPIVDTANIPPPLLDITAGGNRGFTVLINPTYNSSAEMPLVYGTGTIAPRDILLDKREGGEHSCIDRTKSAPLASHQHEYTTLKGRVSQAYKKTMPREEPVKERITRKRTTKEKISEVDAGTSLKKKARTEVLNTPSTSSNTMVGEAAVSAVGSNDNARVQMSQNITTEEINEEVKALLAVYDAVGGIPNIGV